jgi:hypothetical protein
MYAGPHRCRFAFFLDVVAAISDEGPSMAVAHHVGPKVAAIGAANRDGSAVAVEGPGFVGNLAVADKGAQVFGGSPVRQAIRRRTAGPTRVRRFPIADRSRRRS